MVEVTTQQMALTRDTGPGGFMERVTAMLVRTASVVLIEPVATPFHAQRSSYAQQVIHAPQTKTTEAGPQVVMGVNVIAATAYFDVTKTSVCSIADIDLESQITTLWNALAGIDAAS